jgi:hypothetical protein
MPPPRALLPPLAAASVALAAGLLYALGCRTQYYALAEAWGAAPFRTPFLDIHGVTAAVQCHRLGFDVYVQNPCDVFGRLHAYSPLWLWFAVLPVTTAWDVPLGLGLALLFVVSLSFLPPGRDWHAAAILVCAATSSATMFALERANVDLLMFAMAVLAVRSRAAGYAAALLAGMLKFYPIALLVLAVRERLMLCLGIWAAALATIALWFALDARDILRGMANVDSVPPFAANIFGAGNLPFGLAAMAGASTRWAVALEALLLVAMVVAAAALAKRLRPGVLTIVEATYLLAGAALVVSCFMLAQNIAYRAIYFLFVLPGLTALAGAWRAVAWLIVLLMWHNALRVASGYDYWLMRELGWWLVITLLMALLLRLIWDAPPAHAVRARWARREHRRDK